MRIHREGLLTIVSVFLLLIAFNWLFSRWLHHLPYLRIFLDVASLVFFIFILRFFRNPVRSIDAQAGEVYSPCDGKVVVIEETEEPEYFKGRRIQVSIFMSPLNVHVNYHPVNGLVKYLKYHAGKHLVAWHPKSSTENERSTVVYAAYGKEILLRQIAGTVARRIVTYPQVGDEVKAGGEVGFIKFGSRVDVFLPVGTVIRVKLNEKVTGATTLIGQLAS
jgi:phosphatidylserine decarboxylase